jgi:hypothetical protein
MTSENSMDEEETRGVNETKATTENARSRGHTIRPTDPREREQGTNQRGNG